MKCNLYVLRRISVLKIFTPEAIPPVYPARATKPALATTAPFVLFPTATGAGFIAPYLEVSGPHRHIDQLVLHHLGGSHGRGVGAAPGGAPAPPVVPRWHLPSAKQVVGALIVIGILEIEVGKTKKADPSPHSYLNSSARSCGVRPSFSA